MKEAIKKWVDKEYADHPRLGSKETGLDKEFLLNMIGRCMADIGHKWIAVGAALPELKAGQWSAPVIAMCDAGLIYKLSYFGGEDGCWQRTNSFCDNASKKVTHWMPLPKSPD